MSEKFMVACDDCKHVSTSPSLLAARADAEGHGRRCGHGVRVYVTRTEQVGSYDHEAEKFTLLARSS